MKTTSFCIAALLAVLPLALPAQEDTRLRAMDRPGEARGWEAIGRLDTALGFCTGTLIAPDLVLTAAHCVYDLRDGQILEPDRMVFRAGYRAGRAVADSRVDRVVAHPDFDPHSPPDNENVWHDVALLRLADPIPTSLIDPFLLHEDRIAPGPVSIVSYGRGRTEVQSRQRGCNLTERFRSLFIFDCDVTQGSSGAPVFSHLNGRGRIVSVISAEVQISGREVALGMDVAPMVAELKAMMRAGPVTPPPVQINRIQVDNRADGARTVRVPGAKSVRPPGG